MDQLTRVNQVAIIGTGLLGTSVGLGLKAVGYRGTIVGVARQPATRERAVARGAVDRATPHLAEAVAGSDLIILAVPLGRFDAVLAEIAPHLASTAVLTDVGSTKQDVLAAAHRQLDEATARRFVGAHPMAGSEQQGPDAARPDLFQGKPCILTPESNTEPDALALVEDLWQSLDMTLLRMSPEEHDRQTAVISHLPHAAAVLLVQVAAEQGGWDIASTGFRDTTRLASSNPPMRADILTANRAAVAEMLTAYRGQIDRLIQILKQDDREALLALLEHSRAERQRWLDTREGKQGEATEP